MQLQINYACTHAWSGKSEKTLRNCCIPFNRSACYGAKPRPFSETETSFCRIKQNGGSNVLNYDASSLPIYCRWTAMTCF